MRIHLVSAVFCFLIFMPHLVVAQQPPDDHGTEPTAYRAEWMYEGSYGVMVHYLVTPSGTTDKEKADDFNRIVNGFDVDSFIQQFTSTGADWLIFTIGQNTGYYCSPNLFLDRAAPGHTSDRDLILEIGRRIKELKKSLIVYLPAEVTQQSDEIKKAFGWQDDDPTAFLDHYLQFVKDYSLMYGPLCDGWWFDGCYDNIHKGKWDWNKWLGAARAGNYYSAVAFNDGSFCVGREQPVSPLQDFLSGEVHLLEDGKIRMDFLATGGEVYKTPEGHLRLRGQEPKFYMPEWRCVKGVQWHALVPVDSSFAAPAVPNQHYNDDQLFPFVLNCRAKGCAVTLNVPISEKGHIPDETQTQLGRLGAEMRKQIAGEEKRHPLGKTNGTLADAGIICDPLAQFTVAVFKEAIAKGSWSKALSMRSSETRRKSWHYLFAESFLKDMIPIDALFSNPTRAWQQSDKPYIVPLDIIDGEDMWFMLLKPSDGTYMLDLCLPLTAKEWLEGAAGARDYRKALESKGKEEYLPTACHVKTRLVFEKKKFRAGEPIPCQLEILNESGKDLKINYSGFAVYGLSITGDTDEDVATPLPKTIQVGMWNSDVKAGGTTRINLSRDLGNEHHILRQPGEYTLQQSGGALRLWAEMDSDAEKASKMCSRYPEYSDLYDQKLWGKESIHVSEKLPPSDSVRIIIAR